MRTTAVILAVIAATLTTASCGGSNDESLGPPSPTGATEIPGGPMEQVPSPTSPVVPASQKEAQDTINQYLLRTIDALPKGTTLDGRRYAVGRGTSFCEDDPRGDDPPVKVTDWRDMAFPPGTDYAAVISQTGDIWKGWGWQVLERDGFEKPNRFGYAPDGYILQIGSRPDKTQPPSLIASSPCFPESREGDVKKIPVITQSS